MNYDLNNKYLIVFSTLNLNNKNITKNLFISLTYSYKLF